jgi:hypothetical protein
MVRLDNRMERPLPAHSETVLKHMFQAYEEVIIKTEFDSGLSGSHVFLVRPIREDRPELPSVVKIDRVERIEQEWQAFQQCIQYRLPNVAEIRGQPVYPPGSAWGGLWYPLAGAGTFAIQSLYDYIQRATSEDIIRLLEGRLFKSLGALWEQKRVRPEFHVQTYYDSFLPVNLVIEVAEIPAGTRPHWLQPDNARRQRFTAGDYVQLAGFRVAKVWRDKQRLSLDIPPDQAAAYRLHIESIADINAYRVGQLIQQPLTGVVKQTRHDQLVAQAQKVVGKEEGVTAGRFTLANGVALPNPLHALPDLLNRSFDANLACVHGDLNLQNVLVEPESGAIYLIDFAHSRQDHVLRDLLHLEMAVITKVLAPALKGDQPVATTMLDFYQRLICALRYPGQVDPPAGLEKPFAIVHSIRQTAGRYLFKTDDWAEYNAGLTIYLLGALKFDDLDRLPSAPRPKQAAFWGAAVAQGVEQGEVTCEGVIRRPAAETATMAARLKAQPAARVVRAGGIPAERSRELRNALLDCGPFNSQRDIRAVFADERLSPWRNRLPEADSLTGRVEATIAFLHNQRHARTGENALVTLLHVLSERLDPDDACYDRLADLAEALTAAPGPAETAPPTAPPRQGPPPPLTTVELYQLVARYYNESDLRDLCLLLGIDFENLPGRGKSDKARELALYCERHGLTAKLIGLVWEQRPHAFE